jgi:hypothetical protein
MAGEARGLRRKLTLPDRSRNQKHLTAEVSQLGATRIILATPA